jgi:hypothetical protein
MSSNNPEEKIDSVRVELQDKIDKLERRLDGGVATLAAELEATEQLLAATIKWILGQHHEHQRGIFGWIGREADASCGSKESKKALRTIIGFDGEEPAGWVIKRRWWLD